MQNLHLLFIARSGLADLVMGLCDCDSYYTSEHPHMSVSLTLLITHPSRWAGCWGRNTHLFV